MNDFESGTQASRCYEQLRVVVDMSKSRSLAQSSRCYEELLVVIDMKDYRS